MGKSNIDKALSVRYMVVRIDEHGSRYFVERTTTRKEAENHIADLLSQQLKPHYQTYDILAYEIGHIREFLEQNEIRY